MYVTVIYRKVRILQIMMDFEFFPILPLVPVTGMGTSIVSNSIPCSFISFFFTGLNDEASDYFRR